MKSKLLCLNNNSKIELDEDMEFILRNFPKNETWAKVLFVYKFLLPDSHSMCSLAKCDGPEDKPSVIHTYGKKLFKCLIVINCVL